MRTPNRFVAAMALIATCAPSLARGSERAPCCSGLPALVRAHLFENGPGHVAPDCDGPLLTLEAAQLTRELPCSLVGLNDPELPATSPSPPRLLTASRPAVWHFPSLGGPSLTLTSLDALPSLRDEVAQTDQEDTLRLFRSHW